jgi:hypothetical protein
MADHKNDLLLKRERLLRVFILAIIFSVFFTYNHPLAYLILGIFNVYVIFCGFRTINIRHEFELEKLKRKFLAAEEHINNK